LENGGSGYFPKRIVLPHLKAKRLNVIRGAPEFSMPAYVVYPLECNLDLLGSALGIMHRIANPKGTIKAGKKTAKPSARKGR
jgi:hypothetical protein